MDIQKTLNSNFEHAKKKEDILTHISGMMVRKRPFSRYTFKERIMNDQSEEKIVSEEMPKLQREYTRGEMIDVLMTFPNLSALYESYVVKYNSITKRFYSVNGDFDFSYALANEKWIVS